MQVFTQRSSQENRAMTSLYIESVRNSQQQHNDKNIHEDDYLNWKKEKPNPNCRIKYIALIHRRQCEQFLVEALYFFKK